MNRRTIERLVAGAAAVVALCAASAACAQYGPVPAESSTTLEFDGFSVASPPGSNWVLMKRDRQQAFFGKQIKSRTHSFVVTVISGPIAETFGKPEEFREFVNKIRIVGVDPARHRIIEHHAELDASFPAWCVKYRSKTEDRDAPHAQGRALPLDHFGVTCLHPTLPDLIIDVGYSERGRSAEISAGLRAEGESSVRSLKFTPRRP